MHLNPKAGSCVVGLALLTASWACGLAVAPEQAAPAPDISLVQPAVVGSNSETRRLALEYPSWIRVGDSYVIRLTLDAASLAGATPIARVGANLAGAPAAKTMNPDEIYNVIAEARLDLEGVEVRPSTAVSEPLLPGESVAYRWIVRTTHAGTYRGTAWLVLVFVDRASGAQTRMPISAQPVQIRATSLLGLGGAAARVLGGVGTAVAFALVIPFASAALKSLRSRPRPNA